jgi:ribose 5-phosphate isomerase A
MDSKKALAAAAFAMVKPGFIVGLGASSVMPALIELLWQERQKGSEFSIVSSSFITRQLLLEKGLQPQPISNHSYIDIYFDGCDQVDHSLNAVKSGAGIHTMEKLLASMSSQFVLMGEEIKYTNVFDTKFPLVLEVLPEAFRFIQTALINKFNPAKIALRIGEQMLGPAITGNGNYLINVWFEKWPNPEAINDTCRTITGVVETSFFYQLAHKAILLGKEEVYQIEKSSVAHLK